jgi:DNA-binding NtrC family response regulator
MNTLKRVLIVDDDPDVRTMITAFLSPGAFQVIEAGDLAAALHELSTGAPIDLAILDFWLGQDHAVSIMDAIRSSGLDAPIIMISGGNRSMDLEATEAISDISGAVAFLQKPFRKAIFLDAVKSALTR